MSPRIDPIRWSNLASTSFRTSRSFSIAAASVRGSLIGSPKNLRYFGPIDSVNVSGSKQKIAGFAILSHRTIPNVAEMPHAIDVYYPRWVWYSDEEMSSWLRLENLMMSGECFGRSFAGWYWSEFEICRKDQIIWFLLFLSMDVWVHF